MGRERLNRRALGLGRMVLGSLLAGLVAQVPIWTVEANQPPSPLRPMGERLGQATFDYLLAQATVIPDPTPVVPLRPVPAATMADFWATVHLPQDRRPLLQAIQHSLTYLATPKAATDYQTHPTPGVTQERVARSLRRLRQLVQNSPNDAAF